MPGDETYVDPQRAPLDVAALRAALVGDPVWRELEVLEVATSTNDVAAAAARAGAAAGLVIVAEQQTAGRGRLGREWVSPPGAGLMISVVVRPDVPTEHWTWLPLIAGLSTVRALRSCAGVTATLKWPNDVLVAGRKAGGLLAEVVDSAVVLGIGLNVTTTRAELPGDDATSLALESGAAPDRGGLLLALLDALGRDYAQWLADAGDAASVLAAYRASCDTIGRDVRVVMPTGAPLLGRAVDVDAHGRLLVRTEDDIIPVSAGDVVHVRPMT